MTEGKRMKPTSQERTSPLRTAGGTQALGDSRLASSSLVAGSSSWTDRQARISQVAYYKAQRRDFAPGHDWEDWFDAEREVIKSDGAGTVVE
jgi:hypothetical protein